MLLEEFLAMRQESVTELKIFTCSKPIFWKQVVFFCPVRTLLKKKFRLFIWFNHCIVPHSSTWIDHTPYPIGGCTEISHVALRTMHIINRPWAYSFPQVRPPQASSSLPVEGTVSSCTGLKIQSVAKLAGAKSPWNKYSQVSNTPNYDRNLISLLHSHPHSTFTPKAKLSPLASKEPIFC